MNRKRIETTLGMCIVILTRHIMKMMDLEYETAYKKLLTTDLYKLLQDPETRLYLETNAYLCEACRTELIQGKEALYEYINADND